jgi:hypothetical protein
VQEAAGDAAEVAQQAAHTAAAGVEAVADKAAAAGQDAKEQTQGFLSKLFQPIPHEKQEQREGLMGQAQAAASDAGHAASAATATAAEQAVAAAKEGQQRAEGFFSKLRARHPEKQCGAAADSVHDTASAAAGAVKQGSDKAAAAAERQVESAAAAAAAAAAPVAGSILAPVATAAAKVAGPVAAAASDLAHAAKDHFTLPAEQQAHKVLHQRHVANQQVADLEASVAEGVQNAAEAAASKLPHWEQLQGVLPSWAAGDAWNQSHPGHQESHQGVTTDTSTSLGQKLQGGVTDGAAEPAHGLLGRAKHAVQSALTGLTGQSRKNATAQAQLVAALQQLKHGQQAIADAIDTLEHLSHQQLMVAPSAASSDFDHHRHNLHQQHQQASLSPPAAAPATAAAVGERLRQGATAAAAGVAARGERAVHAVERHLPNHLGGDFIGGHAVRPGERMD